MANHSLNVTLVSTVDQPIDHTTTSIAIVCVLLIFCACSFYATITSKRYHKVTPV